MFAMGGIPPPHGDPQGHGHNSVTLLLGGSVQPSGTTYGRLADGVQVEGVWGSRNPQHQIHEHRFDAQMASVSTGSLPGGTPLETLPKYGGSMGIAHPCQVPLG
jgi:hypothetical protein